MSVKSEKSLISILDKANNCALLHRGGEADVYELECGESRYALKWYHEGFRYDVSPESFESILEYLRTGIYETFEKCKRESEALDAGEDFQMMVLKQFVEAGMSLKYVPLFREYTDKITGSYFYLKGKVVFRVNRTQELINYLRENSQTI